MGNIGLQVFQVDGPTGLLSGPVTGPTIGTNPTSVVVAPQGKFACIANNGDNNLAAYKLDEITGLPSRAITQPTGQGPPMVVPSR
jgi:6-phosphogluconolactonase (cycloisomerase 2 family)